MAIVGSVLDSQTVTAHTEKALTLSFPEAGLTVVGVLMNAVYIKVPIDSTRVAVLPMTGGNVTSATPGFQQAGAMRKVNWTLTGQTLNYTTLAAGTNSTVVFYYGTPLTGSLEYKQFSGVVATATLSSGAGSATFTFPSGQLTMKGFAGTIGIAAASQALQAQWSTSSGKTFTAYVLANSITAFDAASDIISLNLPVAQSVTVTLSGGVGSDIVYIYGFYQ